MSARKILMVAGRLAVTTVAALSSALAIAGAGHICWIEKVTAVGTGIELHFASNAHLQVVVRDISAMSGNSQSYVVDGGAVKSGGGAASGVVLSERQEAYMRQIPEDSCVVRASVKDGKRGVLVESHMHLPGMPPATSSEFLPLE